MVQAVAFKERSNVESYTVKKNGVDFNLVAADIIKIEVHAGGAMIDSDSNAVNFTGSTLEIEYGALPADSGNHGVTVIAFTATDSKGKVLFGPGMDGTIELLLQSI